MRNHDQEWPNIQGEEWEGVQNVARIFAAMNHGAAISIAMLW